MQISNESLNETPLQEDIIVSRVKRVVMCEEITGIVCNQVLLLEKLANGLLSRVYTSATCCAQQAARNTQLVAGNKHHVARSKLLVARNKLRVARSLLRATSCAGVSAALSLHRHLTASTTLHVVLSYP